MYSLLQTVKIERLVMDSNIQTRGVMTLRVPKPEGAGTSNAEI